MAGFIDTIAGGGGLITIPALLFAGIPPVQAIASNKLQACFGTFTATRYFVRANLVSPKKQIKAIIATAIGAMLGAIAIQLFNAKLLIMVLPYGLIAIALYMLLSKSFGQTQEKPKLPENKFNASFASGIGAYDGFFGPGTGTFFTLAYSKLRGMNLIQANAHAKLLNFTTNIFSLIVFILSGQVLWQVGLAMAAGQIIGSRMGAATVVKKGNELVRYMTVVVCIAMSISLLIKES